MANSPLTPEQIDQFERMKQLTPETASLLRSQASAPAPMSPAPEGFQPTTTEPATSAEIKTNPFALPADQQSKLANTIGISPEAAAPVPQGSSVESMLAKPNPQTVVGMYNEGLISDQTATNAIPQRELTADDFVQPQMQQPQSFKCPSFKGLEGAYNQQIAGLSKAAQAGAEMATQEAAYLGTLKKEMEAQEAERIQAEQRRQAEMEKERKKLDDMNEKLMGSKVDPRRYWSSKSGGEKFMSVLGVILGGLGAGMQGSDRNLAMEVIQKEIDRDIDAQKEEINKLKDAAGIQNNLLYQMRQQFGDERQAEAAAKLFKMNQAELYLKQLSSQYKAPQIQANAQVAIGQIQAQKEIYRMQFDQAAHAKQIRLAGGQKLPEGIDIEMLSPDQRERYVPGLGLATTKAGAKEVREMSVVNDTVSKGVNDLLAFTNKSFDSVTPSDRARAQTIASMLIGALRLPIVGPGAVSVDERKLLESIVANPTNIWSLDASSRAALETIRTKIQEKLNDTAKANGIYVGKDAVSTFKPSK